MQKTRAQKDVSRLQKIIYKNDQIDAYTDIRHQQFGTYYSHILLPQWLLQSVKIQQTRIRHPYNRGTC